MPLSLDAVSLRRFGQRRQGDRAGRRPRRSERSEDLARTKRLVEWAYLDLEVRDRLLECPETARTELGLDVDAAALRPVLERLAGADEPIPEPVAPSVERFRNFVRERRALRDRMRSGSAPRNPIWARWRQRQIRRCELELPPAAAAAIVHAPFAIELNRGCSVGCWFCGVGATRLVERASYEATGSLWREILEALGELCGEAARHGFLYWATDPLDNPDYERFGSDFWRIFGRFPMTTTALPTRDPERTRSLLEMSEERGCELNRFSILSRGLLKRVFAEFSPEELLHVDCLPLNRESGYSLAFAGHARRGSPGRRVSDPREASTIACVSGFLINLVERRVRLITPCNASDRWPLGYWVLGEARFRDGDSLAAEMRRMLEAQPASTPDNRPLRWHRDLEWSVNGADHRLRSKGEAIELEASRHVEWLGEELARGRLDRERLVLELEAERGIALAESLFLLERWFERGLLCEEPAPSCEAPPAREARPS